MLWQANPVKERAIFPKLPAVLRIGHGAGHGDARIRGIGEESPATFHGAHMDGGIVIHEQAMRGATPLRLQQAAREPPRAAQIFIADQRDIGAGRDLGALAVIDHCHMEIVPDGRTCGKGCKPFGRAAHRVFATKCGDGKHQFRAPQRRLIRHPGGIGQIGIAQRPKLKDQQPTGLETIVGG